MLEMGEEDVLNFDTDKSFRYFAVCKENHKAMPGFEVFLRGTEFTVFSARRCQHLLRFRMASECNETDIEASLRVNARY